MSHWSVMVNGTSHVFAAGPPVVKRSLGQEISKEDLGGAPIAVALAGSVDNAVETEADCFAMIRRYLSYMPQNVWELPPVTPCDDPTDRRDEELATIVPSARRKAYDMRKIVRMVFDRGSMFEIQPTYGKAVITCLARLNGKVVGVVASNPMAYGGAIDAKAARKQTHFIELCDTFHIPLVFLVDVPGFLVGSAAEDSALARRSGRLLFELAQATVPRLSVIMRKGYGLAYIAMCGGRSFDADLCVAWPTAEICAMSVEGAVDVAYAKQVAASPDPQRAREALIQQIRERLGSLHAAEHFGIDDVIDPRDTRAALIATLERCQLRKHGRQRSPRQHGISPI